MQSAECIALSARCLNFFLIFSVFAAHCFLLTTHCHLMTLSAHIRTLSGIVRPSIFAVFN